MSNKYEQLSHKRKQLQQDGLAPAWMSTASYQLLSNQGYLDIAETPKGITSVSLDVLQILQNSRYLLTMATSHGTMHSSISCTKAGYPHQRQSLLTWVMTEDTQ